LIVTGNYHEFGEFVSQVAALPRIVTLHDMKIEQDKNELKLELQAKTYRAQQTELTE
jgi:type IV pilus assembly protein PilO